jgi:DNA-binding NarL/FixJ family response regulator
MHPTTIVIVDDHTLLRETWTFILDRLPNFRVVACCGSGEEALMAAKVHKPILIMMDINLKGMTGIEATTRILEQLPDTKIVAVSLHNEPLYARKMMDAGAAGYITKNSPKEELIKGLGEIVKGKRYICEEIKDILTEEMISGAEPTKNLESLSERELQIIQLVKSGYSSKEIASMLMVALKTVEVHRHNILRKLGLKNAAALVNFANKYVL